MRWQRGDVAGALLAALLAVGLGASLGSTPAPSATGSPPQSATAAGAPGLIPTTVATYETGARLAAPNDPSPRATRELLDSILPPARDEADLVRRFKYPCGTQTAAGVSLYRDEAVDESRPFWVFDEPNRRYFQAQATLRYTSAHLLFYVQDGIRVAPDLLAVSAGVFEEKTFPLLRQYFGALPTEPRITIFNGRVPGVGGYFSASDLFPQSVNPYSNERVLVYMNLDATRPGGPGYDSVLAHETQHFVHWVVHPQQDAWINEGASELAMAIAGYDQSSYARSFLGKPETQLNGWAARPAEAVPNYGAGYLMLEYFAERFGGYEAISRLIAAPGDSVHTFDSFLAQQHSGLHFDDLFRDFAIANLLNDRSIADGRFGYDKLSLHARIQEPQRALPATSHAQVQPYGTRYVELIPGDQHGDLTLRFSGAGQDRLFGDSPHSGQMQWWGNAADEMESTLTREFDLTTVKQATLQFATWFSTEQDYDYAGVAVSTNGGCSWQTLPGRYTTDSNPTGQNLGQGFTGNSGGGDVPVWLDEAMDLTPFAGQKVLIRFFYVTDQSYHASGVAIDDIAIPEIGFSDDAETDRGWEANGFLRSMNAASLDWAVQVVTFGNGSPAVQQMPVTRLTERGTADGAITVPGFGEGISRVVVAISPLVPVTLEPAEYQLEAQLR